MGKGMAMRMGGLIGLILLVTAAGADPATQDVRLSARFTADFGGHQPMGYALSVGSTLGLPSELATRDSARQLPVSGWRWCSRTGLNPLLLGVALRKPQDALHADDDGGLSWAWITVGAVLAAGVVIVAADADADDGGANSSNSSSGQGGVGCFGDECLIPCNSTGPLITCNEDG